MSQSTRIGVLVFDGVEELDAVGPYEVFGNAASRGADLTVEVLAARPTDRVTAAYGLRVEPDGVLVPGTSDPHSPMGQSDSAVRTRPAGPAGNGADGAVLDYLVVPGGGWNDRADTGAWAVARDDAVLDAIRGVHEDGTALLSVCTGAMILAAAGVLDGRPAVTHHGALDDLRATDAEVVEARVVDDGDVVTSGGITAGLDVALRIVEREWGPELAASVSDGMEYERQGGRSITSE